MQSMKDKTVLIFGVFDMLHPGHKYLINEALKLGGILHICLATDEYVKTYKNKKPLNNYLERQNKIKIDFPNVVIHQGDTEIGQWSIFKQITPNVVIFGYDQLELMNAVKDYYTNKLITVDCIILPAYKPELYKTSFFS